MKTQKIAQAAAIAAFAMALTLIGCQDAPIHKPSLISLNQISTIKKASAITTALTSVKNTVFAENTAGTEPPADTSENNAQTETPPAEVISDNISETDNLPPLATMSWGLTFRESQTQPSGPVSQEQLTPYSAYYLGDSTQKTICLTFDCGYENGNTEPIINALKKHNAPATFFVTGSFVRKNPDLVNLMVENGYAVGNHTNTHPNMTAVSAEEFAQELKSVENNFYEATGTNLSPYFRPPQGICNSERFLLAKQLGYKTIFWSLAYVDYDTDNQPSHDAALAKLTSRIHPGAIVLLHNTSKTNGEILDDLLTKWEEMGYSFQPLSSIAGE